MWVLRVSVYLALSYTFRRMQYMMSGTAVFGKPLNVLNVTGQGDLNHPCKDNHTSISDIATVHITHSTYC